MLYESEKKCYNSVKYRKKQLEDFRKEITV